MAISFCPVLTLFLDAGRPSHFSIVFNSFCIVFAVFSSRSSMRGRVPRWRGVFTHFFSKSGSEKFSRSFFTLRVVVVVVAEVEEEVLVVVVVVDVVVAVVVAVE